MLLVGSCGSLSGENGPLSRARVDVRLAVTASAALDLQRTTPASLIAMDLDLPDATAEQLCERVRGDGQLRDVSLLVFCGEAEAERRRAADCRANAHVVRPVDADALADSVLPLLAVPSRADYRVLAQVRARGYSFFCTSENVSPSGMLLETDADLDVGDVVECSFFLPGKVRIATNGKVVRRTSSSKGRRLGVKFVEPAADVAGALERFVEDWRSARPAGV